MTNAHILVAVPKLVNASFITDEQKCSYSHTHMGVYWPEEVNKETETRQEKQWAEFI